MSKHITELVEEIKHKISKMREQRIRIAVFGQPGAGKSSLINNIIGREEALVSVHTDATTQVQTYEHENLLIADFPGYGTVQFPADNYLQRFQIWDYDIFLCVFSGKLHTADISLFRQLESGERQILFVRSYADSLWQADKTLAELRQEVINNVYTQIGSRPEVFFISNINAEGVEALIEGIKELIEPAKRDALMRSVRAESIRMLEEKYRASAALISSYCRLAALNGINPIPGLDIALDMSILFKMFADIRKVYGLSEMRLNKAAAVLPLAKQVMVYGTEWGLASLLKNVGKRVAIGKAAKYVPLIGSAAAATISYMIVQKAGNQYLADCKQLAEELLELKLDEDSI